MKYILMILYCLFVTLPVTAQNIYTSKNAAVSFFSGTVMEDIEGKSNTASSVLDLKSGNIIFRVANTSFQFKKKLMQEHFNENYIESDKYQFSVFKGKLVQVPDLSKDGNYNLSAEGSLDLHGVIKSYQTKVELIVNKGIISARSVFKVRIADHQIKVPSMVFKNIAEFVEVRVSAVYQPKTL
jgi:hypothetical protein